MWAHREPTTVSIFEILMLNTFMPYTHTHIYIAYMVALM